MQPYRTQKLQVYCSWGHWVDQTHQKEVTQISEHGMWDKNEMASGPTTIQWCHHLHHYITEHNARNLRPFW